MKITDELEDLVFYVLDDEVLRLTLDGRIILRGKELAKDANLGRVIKAYCKWLRIIGREEG